MRKLFLLLISSSLFYSSCENNSSEELSTCLYTTEFAEQYRTVATMLNAFDSNLIDLDQEITDRILEKLYAISNHPESDNFFQIINDSIVNSSLDSFSISLYLDSIETQQLLGTGFSSNTEFDNLINLYGITFDEASFLSNNSITFNIALDNELNTVALTSELRNYPFVSYATLHNTSHFSIPGFAFGIGYFVDVHDLGNTSTRISLYVLDAFCFTPPPPPTITHSFEVDENCVVTEID